MHKVIIRPLKFSDASTSYVWRNDAEVWKFTGNKPNLLVTEELERIWISNKLLEKNSNRFALEVDDKYIGNIQLTNVTDHDAEFHIFIGNKDYWGKGIAYIAILQLLRYAKNKLPIKKIYLNVNPENKSAINLYKKVGFKIIDDLVNMEFQLENEILPTVSVFCMVYNHEKYLRQCLDGFLMQKCNFDFDIVIGEDCSTDKSREILLDYAKRYPGKFKLILHDKNVGAMENQRIVFENCTGKYIAMCEGDDYWIDQYKLQKQVDFMEANDLDCCNTLWQELENNQIINKGHIQKGLMVGNSYQFKAGEFSYYHTATRVIRKDVLDQIMISYPPHFIADGPLQVVLSQTKKVGVLLDYTSVYRISGSGVWTSLTLRERNLQSFKACREFQKYFPKSARKFANEKWNYWLTANFPKSLNHSQRLHISKFIMEIEFFLGKIQRLKYWSF